MGTPKRSDDLLQVTVAGSTTLHYTVPGSAFTLCGRQPQYRHRYMPNRPACRTCQTVAARDHLAVPR